MKETFTYIAPQSQLKKLKEKKEKPERKNLTSRQMKNDIKKFKKNIDEIILARKENRLSERYNHSVDYEDKASEDVQKLEDKIHELERLINGEGEEKDDSDEKKTDEEESEEKVSEQEKGGDDIEKENKIRASKSFDELFVMLGQIGIIKGSKKDFLPGELIALIGKVRRGEHTPDYITRSLGLKDTVERLLKEEAESEKQDGDKKKNDGGDKDKNDEGDKLNAESANQKTEADRVKEKRRRLGIVDTNLIEKRARDIASERMTEDKDSLRGVSGFFKKIWKHNWMGEYYRAKETDKIKAELMGAGSTFSEGDTGGVIDRRIKESILNRFLEDSTELIHADAGEWKDTVEFQEKKALAESRIREAIKIYATALDPDQAALDFKAERDRIYADIFANKDGSFNALNVADNVFEFAKEIRGQVEHGQALSELDLDFELTIGGAKTGVRTEAHYSWVEKKIQQLSSTWVGRFFNETTIAAGVSAAMILTKIGTGKGARAAMGLAGGMVLAGGVAGLRESQMIELDRTEHARSMASGRGFNPAEAPRRKELQEAMYEMISAKTATEDLQLKLLIF